MRYLWDIYAQSRLVNCDNINEFVIKILTLEKKYKVLLFFFNLKNCYSYF